jgi:hypothetical protein
VFSIKLAALLKTNHIRLISEENQPGKFMFCARNGKIGIQSSLRK